MLWMRRITDKDLFVSVMPRGFGEAWRLPELRASVIAPVPLNVLLGICYRLYWCLVWWSWPEDKRETRGNILRHKAYSEGFEVGGAVGYRKGWDEGKDVMFETSFDLFQRVDRINSRN